MPGGLGTPAVGGLTVTAADGAILDGVDSDIKATVRDYTNANPLAVSLTDNSGDVLTALPVSQSGTWNITNISGTISLPTGAATSAKQLGDGHNVTIDNASSDEVYVRGSQSAGSAVDGEVMTVQGIASMTALAVTESSPISGFATSTKQLADGHNVTVDNAAGSGVYVRPGTSATFTVDLGTNNDVTIDNSNIVHLEDVAHSTGDAGVMALAVENEDQADLSTGDKDYTPIGVTKEGNVIIKPEGTITVDGTVSANSTLQAGTAIAGKVYITDGSNDVSVDDAATDADPDLDGLYLLGTHALLSARKDANTTIGITAEDSTHNALHVALTDGEGVANVNASGELNVAVDNQAYSYDYIAAAGADEITKGSAGFLHAILVGDAVASAIIEVSDDASDGDGNVVIYLAGDTLGPALYPVNMTMGTGITSDITNQTHVTMIYR